jgi:hypothetical protein
MSDQKPEQEHVPPPREESTPPASREQEDVAPVATFPAGRFWEFTMPRPARTRRA